MLYKKRSRRNIKELVSFLRGSEMLAIKELDDTLIMTAKLVEKAPGLFPVKITRTLQDIYGFDKKYKAGSDLGKSARNRLYHVLEKRDIQRKERRGNIGGLIFVVYLLAAGMVASFWEAKEKSSSATPDNKKQDFLPVRNMLENKYPEFKFKLSYMANTQEADKDTNNYTYTVYAVLKGETELRSFTVKAEETKGGKLIKAEDNFEVQSVELLAERSGIMCYALVSDGDEGQYVVTGITDKNDIPEYIDGIKTISKTDTVKNINN